MTPPLNAPYALLTSVLIAGLAAPAAAAPSPFGPQPQTGTAPPPTVAATPSAEAAPLESVPVADSVTLAEVFDILKRRSPRYKAAQFDVEIARADTRAARVLPNPVLNLAILYLNQGFNQNGVATYYANVTLPLLIAGQRRMRVRNAEVGVRSAEADVKATYHELAAEARSRFVELQAAQERVKVLDEVLADLARIEELISERRRSGSETEYDTMRVALAISGWKVRRAEEQAEAEDCAGRLGALLGVPSWSPRAEGPFAEIGVKTDPDREWPELERTQPGIEAARRHEAHAVKGVDLARRERWPIPAITVGTVAIQNYYSISTTVGLTVPIPVFDWGQGLLARANARSQQARLQKDAVIVETHAELRRAVRLLDHRRKAMHTFEQEVYAKLPALKQMAEDSFRIGKAELSELLDASVAASEVKLTQLDLQKSVIQAEVAVLAITGRIEQLHPR
jgi:outer membrane protein, heavy metal efflux system